MAPPTPGAILVIAYNFALRCVSRKGLVAARVFGATPGFIPRLATSTAQRAPAVVSGGGFAFEPPQTQFSTRMGFRETACK